MNAALSSGDGYEILVNANQLKEKYAEYEKYRWGYFFSILPAAGDIKSLSLLRKK